MYRCEAFFVDLSLPGEVIVPQVAYWFGLFSHRRTTFEWKGLVQVPLDTPAEDADAEAIVDAYIQGQP
jgi:hypothetical protein